MTDHSLVGGTEAPRWYERYRKSVGALLAGATPAAVTVVLEAAGVHIPAVLAAVAAMLIAPLGAALAGRNDYPDVKQVLSDAADLAMTVRHAGDPLVNPATLQSLLGDRAANLSDSLDAHYAVTTRVK